MRMSIRNQLTGEVLSLSKGEAMVVAKVRLDGGGEQILTSAVTLDAVSDLGIEVGSRVTLLVKSTDVALAVE
ncbi:MAG: TOBE domain-containing protein [Propionibacteriaceae bacterium]|nr:TOBE domain-containing protein [Propionibacteriaceae bacterium]